MALQPVAGNAVVADVKEVADDLQVRAKGRPAAAGQMLTTAPTAAAAAAAAAAAGPTPGLQGAP